MTALRKPKLIDYVRANVDHFDLLDHNFCFNFRQQWIDLKNEKGDTYFTLRGHEVDLFKADVLAVMRELPEVTMEDANKHVASPYLDMLA
ncbi:hypothetical protein [Endozoicomonas sp. SESOKO1]|uniref:hypothetical protein n=1 Tax=Endozoicomonas sp. SESOKO1 TaxID=2828742 RepID=UPI0021483DFA|nr:hypothetical protein [Endozoicomonas sp. SESOKO1]